MDTNDMIPTLALMTLIVAVVFAVVGYVLFKRKRANRQRPDGAIATVRERQPD